MSYPGMGTIISNDPKQILALESGQMMVSVTIKTGEGALEKGQVLGIETSSKKYVKYDDAAVDGSEVAKAILGAKVDATSSDQLAVGYIGGAFKKSALVGYDAAALVDLNGKIVGPEGGATTDIVII